MWLLPSRGRVGNAKRFAEANPDAPITLWVTEDDPSAEAYLEVDWPEGWVLVVGMAGLRLAQILRESLRQYPAEEYYGFVGDDVQPSPRDWWQQLAGAAGEWNVAYPEDSIWGERLCPHFCLGGELVRTVGWFALPGTRHSYIDTVWYTIGKALGLDVYVPDVKFDHQHPLNKKAELDDTYRRGQETYGYDGDVFERWKREDLADVLERVKAGMQECYIPEEQVG